MEPIRQILAGAEHSLSAGSPTPKLDARILLQHCLGKDHAWLISHRNEKPEPEQVQQFQGYVERRQGGEPVAYITASKEFWSLSLGVNNDVLIPRPETEILVERALTHIPDDGDCRIVDLGTGSGAVALAIACERPKCELTATDASPSALEVARANAEKHGITNVRFQAGDWLEAVTGEVFDVIVSNPPYIADGDDCLLSGDLTYEPAQALRAGRAGLDAITAIGAQARNHLHPGGILLVEHGCAQQEAVEQILERNGFGNIVCYRDLASLPRVTEGWVIT